MEQARAEAGVDEVIIFSFTSAPVRSCCYCHDLTLHCLHLYSLASIMQSHCTEQPYFVSVAVVLVCILQVFSY